MPRLTPTIRLDAGWLYILAGLALCAAGILVPARRDLEDLRRQLDRLADERAISDARLHAYGSFLHLLNEDDPALIRRLAAAQLNLVPADEKPVLMAASRTATAAWWGGGAGSGCSRRESSWSSWGCCSMTSGRRPHSGAGPSPSCRAGPWHLRRRADAKRLVTTASSTPGTTNRDFTPPASPQRSGQRERMNAFRVHSLFRLPMS
ncbi:MAG: hypothetical protein ACYS0J_20655 [Planctomycetota bacterium]